MLPQHFLFIFLTCPLCAIAIHCLRESRCSAVTSNCFWQTSPGEKSLHPGWAANQVQIKTSLQVRSSRKPSDRTNNESSLGMGLWRSSTPILFPVVTSRPLIFTIIVGCWFSRLQSLGGGLWIGQTKMPESLLFYWNSVQLLFLNKCSTDCWTTLVNFQSSKRVDSDNFC